MSLNSLPKQKSSIVIFALVVLALVLILLGVRLRRVS
jgi:hypothetical protein